MSNVYVDDLIMQMNMHKRHAYIIRLVTDDFWYFYDMETDVTPHPIIWTSRIEDAFVFPDEESVEEFRIDFIEPRQTEVMRITRRKK